MPILLCLQHSIVRRVDNALGLLLELRSEEDAPAEQVTEEAEAEGTAGGKGKKKKKKGGDDKKRGQAQAQPSAPAGYAHISAVSESRIEKLDKVRLIHTIQRVVPIGFGTNPEII